MAEELKRLIRKVTPLRASSFVKAKDETFSRMEALDERIAGLEAQLDVLEGQIEALSLAQLRGYEALSKSNDALAKMLKDNSRFDRIEKRLAKLSEASAKTDELVCQGNQAFQRHLDWGKLEAEYRRLANGRPIWAIECPAPGTEEARRWGDYGFAISLKKSLERLGLFVVIDTRESWDFEAYADVVVVLRGARFFRPDRRAASTRYVMWNISHPDMVSDSEYELYDAVCVASMSYAKEVAERVTVPVFPLLQCTDTDLFHPAEEAESPRWDYIFIGNSRGVARQSVMWAIEDNLPLRMWGSGWNKILADHMDLFEAPTIANGDIPDVYRRSRVTINDHWADMLEKQFVNNRIFDALACGLPVISDTFDELRTLFPSAVLHYSNRAEFEDCVRRIESDYDAVKQEVEAQWPLIQSEFSFDRRAAQLKSIVDSLG